MDYATAKSLWDQGRSIIVSDGDIQLPVKGHVESGSVGPVEYTWTFSDFYYTVQYTLFSASVDEVCIGPEKLTYRLAE
jgi:hypothetical protein